MHIRHRLLHGAGQGAGKPKVHPYKNNLSVLSRGVDGVIIAGTLLLVAHLHGAANSGKMILIALGSVVIFFAFTASRHLYRSWRTDPIHLEAWHACQAWFSTAAIVAFALYLDHGPAPPPKSVIVTWFFLAPLTLIASRYSGRYLLRLARTHGLNAKRLAIVGSDGLAVHVAERILNHPWMGFRIVGLYDDRKTTAIKLGSNKTLKVEGCDRLVASACRGEIDLIYIASARMAPSKRLSLVRRLGNSTASVYLVPDRRTLNPRALDEPLSGCTPLRRCTIELAGITAYSVYETPFLGTDSWVKRMEDITLSLIALTLLALPMVIITLAVKWTSPGPALFKQRRYGLDGKEITVWKFRSMRVCEDGSAIKQAQKNDSRVTPLGAFLRRSSLDELPQLINILQGTMSIVGPRPHAVAHNEHYRKLIGGYMLRHKVKPGLTGWAQVNGYRGETDTTEKMENRIKHDLEYIRNWSLWLDMKIVMSTAIIVLKQENAY